MEKGKEWYASNQDKIKAYREYYKSNPEYRAKKKAYHKKKWLSDEYGLTLEQYEGMLKEQGHCCAICKNGRPDVSGRKQCFMLTMTTQQERYEVFFAIAATYLLD